MNLNDYTFKILDFNDSNKFNIFVEKIKNADDKVIWNSVKDTLQIEKKDFLISACIKNNEILSCTLGYSINYRWNKNVLPFWIMGRYQSIESLNKHCIDVTHKKLTDYFESKNFSVFYSVFKLNRKLTYKNCENYLHRFIEKSFTHEKRYILTVEKILHNNFNYSKLPIFYKDICFKDCNENQSIIIVRNELKYEYRTDDVNE